MTNPFSKLGSPKEVEYDEWQGAFSCQDRDCFEVVGMAKYIKKEKLLTWICSKQHISKLENMDD